MKRSIIAAVVLSTLSASSFAAMTMQDQITGNSQSIYKLRQDTTLLSTAVQNVASKNTKQDAAIAGNASAIATLSSQSGNYVTKSDFTKDQQRQDAATSALGNRVSGAETKIQDLRGITDDLKATNDKQDKAIADKVSVSVFSADQSRQDAKIQTAQQTADKAQQTADSKVSQADFDADQQRQDKNINAAAQAVVKEQQHREAADAALQTQVDKKADTADVLKADTELARRIDVNKDAIGTEVTTREAGDKALGREIVKKVDTTTFTADQQRQDKLIAGKVDNSVFQQRAQALDVAIAEQKAQQQKTNQTVSKHTAQLADHEQRITGLEQQTSARFGDLKNQIDDNKREANAGIAGVAAIATIPQVLESQTFALGAGVGARDGESALAVGFSGRVSQSVVTKVAVSTDTQSGWTVGAGVAVGW